MMTLTFVPMSHYDHFQTTPPGKTVAILIKLHLYVSRKKVDQKIMFTAQTARPMMVLCFTISSNMDGDKIANWYLCLMSDKGLYIECLHTIIQ